MSVAAGTMSTTASRVRLGILAVPVALYGLALLARLAATASISFPLTEGSAYYVAVARNLVLGRGLEIDAIWSYATPPLTLPRPAFELWQPLASFVAALPMSVLGPSFDAAQLGFAVLGAFLAPLAWAIARDAALRTKLDDRRVRTVAIGAGALAAIAGPLVLSAAVPDSTLPFAVLAVASCALMPGAARGERRTIAALGVALALAYLTRMEAVWFGLAFAVLVVRQIGFRAGLPRILGTAAVAALASAPWWLRNLAVFGTPLPGQVSDNILLTRNEQIFGYLERPTLEGFLGQGPVTLAANVANAARHNLVDVLLVPAGVIAAVGLVTLLVSVTRRPDATRALAGSSLVALLIGAAITFVATTLLFPVATLWGTFEHAAGPAVIALTVLAALGADAAVARIREWRDWPRSNSWLAPAALVALTVPITLLQVGLAAGHAARDQRIIGELATALPAALAATGADDGLVLISDRPIWLSDALDRPVIALPDEPVASVLSLANEFDATAVLIVEDRGRHPQALRETGARECFVELPLAVAGIPAASLFTIAPECVR